MHVHEDGVSSFASSYYLMHNRIACYYSIFRRKKIKHVLLGRESIFVLEFMYPV